VNRAVETLLEQEGSWVNRAVETLLEQEGGWVNRAVETLLEQEGSWMNRAVETLLEQECNNVWFVHKILGWLHQEGLNGMRFQEARIPTKFWFAYIKGRYHAADLDINMRIM